MEAQVAYSRAAIDLSVPSESKAGPVREAATSLLASTRARVMKLAAAAIRGVTGDRHAVSVGAAATSALRGTSGLNYMVLCAAAAVTRRATSTFIVCEATATAAHGATGSILSAELLRI
jgi:hypothetical protein